MAAIKGTKKSDVRWITANFKPEAKCLGILDNLDQVIVKCDWALHAGHFVNGRQVRDAAKDHAYFNPDHIVQVDQVNTSQYTLKSKDHENDE